VPALGELQNRCHARTIPHWPRNRAKESDNSDDTDYGFPVIGQHYKCPMLTVR